MTLMLQAKIILLIIAMLPAIANAWWHEDWSYRKELTLDTSSIVTGEALENATVLVRLHTGNFGYFMDVSAKGEDIRFMADDDVTPLKYYIEKFDPVNEMAMIWVQIPVLAANSNTQKIWMYYGNPVAVPADNKNAVLPVSDTLVYHFDTDASAPQDSTDYGNHSSLFTAEKTASSLIAGGIKFNGAGMFEIADTPSLAMDPATGWSMSAWIKIDAAQQSTLFLRRFVNDKLQLAIDGDKLYARLKNEAGNVIETAHNTTLMTGSWHHVALVISGDKLSIFLDGTETAYIETMITEMAGPITIGADTNINADTGFIGEMDELRISKIALSADMIKLAVKGEGPGATVLIYGEDGQQEGGEGEPSYFTTTMQNVTVDGWVVIIVLIVMFAISVVVMIAKTIVIQTTSKDNRLFLEKFTALSQSEVDNLDGDDSADEKEMRESPLLMALSGKHTHFESSSIYRIYHIGVQEMHNRMPKAVGANAASLVLTPQAIDAIRATMDACMIRENQRLNSLMVLLTIAISGGPFLGLLGTVVGVMITFAAIAASGNVDVNAIAPGIAAALAATVAGLAVAIPALFGYNYLGSRLKEISADMHVFVDEFVAKIAEQHC
ncbi:MotA/TolQ/ExbB proton channel family protein [hydrothermal vent metagenome]|uniref:MotA/TolQ/ExbB proton channel family protein n=1 Tax=hydrothermal vent metagenome TaxID=652676 RepID=A0A3B1AWX0_9ZZZZ